MKRIGILLLLVAFASGSVWGQNKVLSQKTIEAIWQFEDGSGALVTDSSPHKRHGNITGSTKWVDGKFGGGLELDGQSGQITIDGLEVPTVALDVKKLYDTKMKPGRK